MKQNKGLLFIVILLISCSFIFGRVEIKYKKDTSEKSFLSEVNSITFSIEGFEFLELGCDKWSSYPCGVFNATSFQVVFEGYDGMIEENKTLKLIDFNKLGERVCDGIEYFKNPIESKFTNKYFIYT